MKYTISKISAKQDQKKIESLFDTIYPDNYYMQKSLRSLFKGIFSYFEKYSLKACVGKEIIAVLIGNSCDIFFELEQVFELNIDGFDDLREKSSFKSHALLVKKEYRNKGIAAELINYLKINNPELHYLWGIQREDISDMDYFLKRRKVVLKNDKTGGTYTLQRFYG